MSENVRTWLDVYPTGRKHCSQCKCWRLGIDFGVRKWADEPHCSIPRTLNSVCKVCQARIKRRRYGHVAPRVWYPHGTPESERYREHRNKKNRESHKKRISKKAYREKLNEYNRIYYEAKRNDAKKRAAEEHERVEIIMESNS